MPLIQSQVVELHPWLTMTQFTDIMTIAEMTPGPIAINSATFVGIQVAGLPGALVATVGCVFPSCVIVLILAYVYYRFRGLTMVQGVLSGLRPAVVAMIASAGISIIITAFFSQGQISLNTSDVNFISVFIFAAALFVLRKWKLNPIWVMAGSGVLRCPVIFCCLGCGILNYIMKSGIIYAGDKALARVKNDFTGSKRRICSMGGEVLLSARVVCTGEEPGDVRSHRCVMADADGGTVGAVNPEYAEARSGLR